MYCGQKLGEDFAKFSGILKIYELYVKAYLKSIFQILPALADKKGSPI